MLTRHSEAFVFSFKAAVSAVLAVVVYDLLSLPGAGWSAISAVLVTQPNLHSSLRASLTRVLANAIGALGGAILCVLISHQLLALALGVLFTGLACYFLKAEDAMRPAFAAVVIVIFNNSPDKWSGPLDRVVAVITGCLCSLLVGALFTLVADKFKAGGDDDKPAPGPAE